MKNDRFCNRWILSLILLSASSFTLGIESKRKRGSIRSRRSLSQPKGSRRVFGDWHGDVPVGNANGDFTLGEVDGDINDLISYEYTTKDVQLEPITVTANAGGLDVNSGSIDESGKGEGKGGKGSSKRSGKGSSKGKKRTRQKKDKLGHSKIPRNKSSFDDASSDDSSSYDNPGKGNGGAGSDSSGPTDSAGTDDSSGATDMSGTDDSSGTTDMSGTDDSSGSDSDGTDSSRKTGNSVDTSDNGGTGTSPTKGPSKPTGEGDSGDPYGSGDLAEITNEISLQYLVSTGSKAPERKHYEDLAHLTGWFLDDFLYAHFLSATNVVFIGSNVNELSTMSTFVVRYKSGTAFGFDGTIPTKGELDDIFGRLLCSGGDQLQLYVDLLQEFDSSNPFSSTTGVECVADIGAGGQVNGDPSVNSKSKNQNLGPIIGAVAGAATVICIFLFFFVKRRRNRGERVPTKEDDIAPEDAGTVEFSNAGDTASMTSNPPPPPVMLMTTYQACPGDEEDNVELPDEQIGNKGDTNVNEMRVLRDMDMLSMDDSEDIDEGRESQDEESETAQSEGSSESEEEVEATDTGSSEGDVEDYTTGSDS